MSGDPNPEGSRPSEPQGRPIITPELRASFARYIGGYLIGKQQIIPSDTLFATGELQTLTPPLEPRVARLYYRPRLDRAQKDDFDLIDTMSYTNPEDFRIKVASEGRTQELTFRKELNSQIINFSNTVREVQLSSEKSDTDRERNSSTIRGIYGGQLPSETNTLTFFVFSFSEGRKSIEIQLTSYKAMTIQSSDQDFAAQFQIVPGIDEGKRHYQIFRNGKLFQELFIPEKIDPQKIAASLLPKLQKEAWVTAPTAVDTIWRNKNLMGELGITWKRNLDMDMSRFERNPR